MRERRVCCGMRTRRVVFPAALVLGFLFPLPVPSFLRNNL